MATVTLREGLEKLGYYVPRITTPKITMPSPTLRQYLGAMAEKHGPGAAIGTAGVLGTVTAAKGGAEWLKDKNKEAGAPSSRKQPSDTWRRVLGVTVGGTAGGIAGGIAGRDGQVGKELLEMVRQAGPVDHPDYPSRLLRMAKDFDEKKALRRVNRSGLIGATALALAGSALGNKLMQRKNTELEKKASFNSAAAPLEKSAYTTMSSPSNNGSMSAGNESAEDSRKRRLAELLKKREHSGTATGSASPNPPKGD